MIVGRLALMTMLAALAGAAAQPGVAAHSEPVATESQAAAIAPPKLEYAFTIELELDPATYLGNTPTGAERAAVYIRKGVITGPMLHGVAVPYSGGDWARKRPDGVLDFDARYLLRLDDGTVVYMQNSGYRWASSDVMARLSKHEPVPSSEYYMRVTPKFEVKTGSYDWLMRYVFVGVAEKTPSGNRINYFIVR